VDEPTPRRRAALVNLRSGIAIVLLGAAAGASYYASRQPPLDTTRGTGGDRELPGYFLHGARILGTDETGHLTYLIHADSLEEMPGRERLTLHGVRIEYTPADDDPWVITAARADAARDGSEVDLDGDVVLRSDPKNGSKRRVVETSALRFTPDESYVESDQAVEVEVGALRLEGVGLRAHLNDDDVELKSKVHGRIAR
jgi:lipopolysaccharide export system protein LptC